MNSDDAITQNLPGGSAKMGSTIPGGGGKGGGIIGAGGGGKEDGIAAVLRLGHDCLGRSGGGSTSEDDTTSSGTPHGSSSGS